MADVSNADYHDASADASKCPSFYRSAPMTHIQLYIPTESALPVMTELGVLGNVQFIDLNESISAFQRTFTADIRRLDELERCVRVLLLHASREQVNIKPWTDFEPQIFVVGTKSIGLPDVGSTWAALQTLEVSAAGLAECEQRVLQLDESHKETLAQFLHTLEWHAVLVALSPYMAWSWASRASSPQHADLNLKDGHVSERSTLSSKAASPKSADDQYHPSSKESADESGMSESMELGIVNSGVIGSDASFVTGAIAKRKFDAFQRVLWRALRGNVVIRSADMKMDARGVLQAPQTPNALNSDECPPVNASNQLEQKSAFVAYVHGRETLVRLRKICTVLGATLYDVTRRGTVEDQHAFQQELEAKLDDMHSLLLSMCEAKRAVLAGVSETLERVAALIVKKKLLFNAMNCLGCEADLSTRRYYLAEAWCPEHELPAIEARLRAVSAHVDTPVAPVLTRLDASKQKPPTHFYTNRFTRVFLELTESYGVASYGEANPSIFMIISFPFLFAVMFGDLGHAFIMLAAALWLVLSERSIDAKYRGRKMDEILSLIYGGRYIILLMSIFSVYVGLIYNDIFSLSISLFPSMWTFNPKGIGQRPAGSTYIYPFGIDWAWSLSSNFMVFLNSYKMKQAILFGILQMVFGICISATNYIYAGSMLDFFAVFLPQLLFMLSIFGYLGFLIVYKWFVGHDISLMGVLISMVLHLGAVEGRPMFPGQYYIQICLLMVAVVCVPWMLLAKPLYLLYEKRRQHKLGYHLQSEPASEGQTVAAEDSIAKQAAGTLSTKDELDAASETASGPPSPTAPSVASVSSTTKKAQASAADDDDHGGEMWVHQSIHTIEFVLGAVSNTASYLRLWALSLAHAELSHVLWNLTIAKFATSYIVLPLVYPLWLAMTIAVLVCMEGMSAFLHALRLHWVEFNNKFYDGTGVKFTPFSLREDDVNLLIDLPNRQ